MAEDRPGEARAGRAALDFARSVTEDADWALLFLEAWAEMLRDPAFRRRLEAVTGEVRDALAALLAELLPVAAPGGEVAPEQLAEMVLAMTHWFGIAHRLDPEHALAHTFAEMMATFAAGVAARSGGSARGGAPVAVPTTSPEVWKTASRRPVLH